MLSTIKRIKDILVGKDCYFPVAVKKHVTWCGLPNAGFYVCLDLLSEQSIVYSVGVGEDISFDEKIIKEKGCEIYAYDPTPKSKLFIERKGVSSLFHFNSVGIADYDGTTKFYLPENDEYVSCSTYNRWGYDENKKKPIVVDVRKLSTLMKENGHTRIDLLKMDVEGSEYAVIDNIIDEKIDICQICVEVHHRFHGIGVRKTKELVKKLNMNGYKIAAVSKTGEEYTFVRCL